MCQELRSLRQSIAAFAGGFDARSLTPAQAAEVVGLCARIEASAASIKALAAARSAEGKQWERLGYRSASEQLADQAGMSPGAAKRALETGQRLGDQPEVAQAALSGELSLEQAGAVSDGVAANPDKAGELIDKAKRSSLPELNDEVAKVKADRADLEARRRARQAKRSLRRWTDRDGAFNARLYGHPEDGARLWRMLDPIRRRLNILRREAGAPVETLDALDYDALMAMADIAIGKDTELSFSDLRGLGLFPQADPGLPPAPPAPSSGSPASAAPSRPPSGPLAPPSASPAPSAPSRPSSASPTSPSPPASPRPSSASPAPSGPSRPSSSSPASPALSPPPSGALASPAPPSASPAPPAGSPAAPPDLFSTAGPTDQDPAGSDPAEPPVRGPAGSIPAEPAGQDPAGSSRAGPASPLEPEPPPPVRGRRTKKLAGSPLRVMIRVDLDALLRGVPIDGELCEIAGYGPVPVSVIEDLIATDNPFIIGLLTKGQALVGVYHHGRHPNAYQRSALDFLHPTCAVEGCSSRAGLQYDHREDFSKTKITAFDLLDRLCRHHHDLKTRDGWALVEGRGKRAFVPPDDPRHPRFGPSPPGRVR